MQSDIAYFSMEIAIDPKMPTYSGGLGVLAGDTIMGAADIGISMVAVAMLPSHGYVRQELDESGEQVDLAEQWNPAEHLSECAEKATLIIEHRTVIVRAWKYIVTGVNGHTIPIFFLDTDLPDNHPVDREITERLYGGDTRIRILQELVLGVGGKRLLSAMGYSFDTYHLNEGHAAFLLVELLAANWKSDREASITEVRKQAVFTTHTPVSVGHDIFEMPLLEAVMEPGLSEIVRWFSSHGRLNMTELAIALSRSVNAVSRRHAQVTQQMFPHSRVIGVTNGVHAARWTSQAFTALFDEHIPGWRRHASQLRHAALIPTETIAHAHATSKERLVTMLDEKFGIRVPREGILIGFARRSTAYKRPLLIFHEMSRLQALAERFGPITILFGGKAHPQDHDGKDLIRHLACIAAESTAPLEIRFVPNYEMSIAEVLCAGVDLWLNTPRAPLEASGTSGMKCALNGVPSLSIADGWWCEGGIQGATGWVIERASFEKVQNADDADDADAESLYEVLEGGVLPTFFHDEEAYREVMRNSIAVNGSYFNTHRMVDEYARIIYENPEDAS